MVVDKTHLMYTYTICNNTVDNIINDRMSVSRIKGSNFLFRLWYPGIVNNTIVCASAIHNGFTCKQNI